MDSLTQIVLGAACGEAILGKKIGNKALLFGAIAGTIPDLDVFVGKLFYSNEIEIMAFHRGIMHSIVFCFFAAFVFGWLTFKVYNTNKRKHTTTLKAWILLYMLALTTHPLLDCFTPYGTQLFAPFTDYRVAFNTISVVDPLYTLPFLITLIILMFYKRTHQKRTFWLKIGVYASSAYLLFTIGLKQYIGNVFKNSFKNAGITYQRLSYQPTLLNTVLWYAIADTKDAYYITFYSLLDQKPISERITKISKTTTLNTVKDKNLNTLRWFSNNYYIINTQDKEDTFTYTDLRYPMLNPKDINSTVFNFTLFKNNNTWDILPFKGSPPSKANVTIFIERIKGL